MGSNSQISKMSDQGVLIQIRDENVERVSEARNLGLIMDDKLQFEKHILNTSRNCFYRLKVLYQIRKFLNTDIRIKLCDSLVLSKFNYMDVVYGPRLLARTRQLIQRVQNSCARFCFPIPPRTHVTPYLNDAKMLKMDYRRKLHLASLLFGVIRNQVPPYLAAKLVWTRDVKCQKTRDRGALLHILRHKTHAFQGTFKYAASKIWNDLPPPLINLKSIKTFRTKYKAHLINLQINSII